VIKPLNVMTELQNILRELTQVYQALLAGDFNVTTDDEEIIVAAPRSH
jgi:hypothetical protein